MKFTIETVSKLTGITAATLRNWEKRYGFPKPQRSDSGHRQYDQRDVSFLRIALKMQNEGRNLAELSSVYESFDVSDAEKSELSPAPKGDDVTYRSQLIYEALLKYDVGATAQQWMILNAKLAPSQLFTLVFEKILRQLGSDWAAGEVSISQEHFISNFLRMKLGAMITLDFTAVHETRFAFATLSDENHEGGLLLIGGHLKFRGYHVHYFGTDMPVSCVADAVKECRAGVLGLSYVSSERLRRDLPALARIEIPVALGGIAVMAMSDKEQAQVQAMSSNLFLCFESSGEKAADYLELISRGARPS